MQVVKKERNLNLDVIRIIAVLAVIMIHVSASFIVGCENSSREFIVGNVFDSISRLAVPFFLMISGALLLDEKKSISIYDLVFVKIKNLLLLLFFWSIIYSGIYNLLLPLITGYSISLKSFLFSTIMGHFHMWYLYMIIGLYLFTPFLRTFVKKENKKLVLLFLLLSLLTQFTKPILNELALYDDIFENLIVFIDKFKLNYFGGYTAYYIAGWYIVHVGIQDKMKKFSAYVSGFLFLLITFLYVQFTKDYSNGYYELNLCVFVYSVSSFVFFNDLQIKMCEKFQYLIEKLSKLCFGVYIIHPLIQDFIANHFYYEDLPLLTILCKFFVISVVSFFACYLISKIPYLQKSIRM